MRMLAGVVYRLCVCVYCRCIMAVVVYRLCGHCMCMAGVIYRL